MTAKGTTTDNLAMRLLREVIGSLGGRYAAFIVAVLLFASLSLLPAQLLRFFTENTYGLEKSGAEAFLWTLLGFGALIAGALWISRLGSVLCQEWLRVTLEAKLRTKILDTLHATPLAALEASQRGEWYSRVTGDLGRVEFFLTESIPSQVRIAGILLGSGSLFLWHSGPLALIPISAALALALFNFVFQKRLAPRLRELRDLHAEVFQILIENFDGIRTLRSHGAERFMRTRFTQRVAFLSTRSMKVVRAIGMLMGTNELFAQVLITICLAGVALFLSRGSIGIHEALLYPFYIGMFYNSAQDLAKSAYDWNRYLIEGSRLASFLYSERTETVADIGPASTDRREILLLDIQVGHEGGPALTPRFDFGLRRGELCLVTGPSGCGKSTFLEMLSGLRPAYDGLTVLPRTLSAYVEQRPYIFEGTIRENLTLGDKGKSAQSLWLALERASLKDFVLRSGGLDYRLRDRGENLSEGERYRLALARAFLLERNFLFLDEPFASLDSASMDVVISALNREKERAGVLVVTHQVPEELDVDRFIRLDEMGKPKQFETVFVPPGAVRKGLPA